MLGQILAASGERDEAIAVLRAAERALDGFASIRPRADSGVDALTKREREIAELVTDRKTNRQIAATLFLSDKTIESHLRNVFVKLGASSRMEVALEIDRHRRAAVTE